MAEPSSFAAARNQLVEDFSKIAADSEALLRAMASMPAEKVSSLRGSVESTLANARQQLRDLQGAAYEKTAAAAKATDEYVHENPWPLIAGAAVLGFALGLLARGGSDD